MNKIISLSIVVFLVSYCISCTDTNEEQEHSNLDKKDTLKVFFYNLSKKSIDSLNSAISQEIMTSKGIDVEKLLLNVSERDTMSYEFYSQYAYLLAIKGSPHNALKYLDLGAPKTKNKSRIYFDKALIWAYIEPLQKRDTLYKYLSLAIKNDSLNAYYYAARSKFYNEDGKNNEALNDINKAIKLAPKDTSYLNLRGGYKILLEDYKGALKDLEYTASNNKNVYEFYMYRAILFNKLKMHKEALQESNKCLTLKPDLGQMYSIRGNSKYNLGDKEGGIQDIRKAASLGDKDAEAFIKKYDDYHQNHKQI